MDGSVNSFVKSDFAIFHQLFHYDFFTLEHELELNCFSLITNYHSVEKAEKYYNKSVSDRVRSLSEQIAYALDEEEVFHVVTEFYKENGVGLIGMNKAFRFRGYVRQRYCVRNSCHIFRRLSLRNIHLSSPRL